MLHFWQARLAPLLTLLFCLLLLAPIIGLGLFAFSTSSDAWAHLWNTVLPVNLKNTVWLVLGVSVLTLSMGTVSAWGVALYDFPARRFWQVGLFLPLVIPAYISAWLVSDAYSALVPWPWRQWLLAQTGFSVHGLSGAILVLSLALYPYVYLAARVAFTTQTFHLIEAAHTLGISRMKAFWRVGLPLALPAIIAGLSLALMETLADYGTVALLGVPTFTTSIYRTWFGLGDAVGAAQLSLVLLLIMLLLLVVRHASHKRLTTPKQTPVERLPLAGWRGYGLSLMCGMPALLGFFLPLGLLLWHAPAGLTADNVRFSVRDALLPSLGLASISALLLVGLCLFLAVRSHAASARWLHHLTHLATLGYALPGAVIAVGMMVTLAPSNWPTNWFVFGTVGVLIGAYIIRFSTVAFNTLDAGLHKLPPHLLDAARSLGVHPTKAFWHVQLPLLKPTLLAAGLFSFVDIIKELPATLILRPFDMTPLSVRIFHLAKDERLSEAAIPALLLVLVCLPITLLLEKRLR